MDEEAKRSCYNCQHQSLCYLRHHVYDAMVPRCAWMFDGHDCGRSRRPWTDVFDVLAEACNQHERVETETEET